AEWLLGAPWRWELGALFNLVCQLSPLVAIVLVERPRVRAVCAALFVIEVIGLGLVMDLWNPQWLPLATAFVDWDWLLRAPLAAGGAAAPPAEGAPRAGRWVARAFVAAGLAASFTPGMLSPRAG